MLLFNTRQAKRECGEFACVDVGLANPVRFYLPAVLAPRGSTEAVVQILREERITASNADKVSSIYRFPFSTENGRLTDELGTVGSYPSGPRYPVSRGWSGLELARNVETNASWCRVLGGCRS